jgi:ATP-dependent helicase/nuclease subunit B
MKLYKIHPSLSFLEVLADFILANFTNIEAITKLRVILPNGLACWYLQNILIQKQGVAILPSIIPFSNILAEGEEIFKIASDKLEYITFLQEKIILAEIINNYPKIDFSITQSLQFCSTIAELFYELASNNLSIEEINQIEQINQSEYWQIIYQFLKYSYQEWLIKINQAGKQDRVSYQVTMMKAELARLNHTGNNLIVAGIVGHNKLSWNFLKNIVSLESGYIILPPIGDLSNDLLESKLAEEDCLYSLKQLLTTLGKKLSDFQSLGDHQLDKVILERLIIDQPAGIINSQDPSSIHLNQSAIDHISYFELEDIFQEAEQISQICKQHSDQKIAIIIDNQTTKNFYGNFLTKYGLEFQDIIGIDLSNSLITSLLISVSEILANEFDIKKLFILLKNPLINQQLVQKLELLIITKTRFILNADQLLDLIERTANIDLIEWGKKLVTLLYSNKYNDFSNILKSSIKIAQKLYSDLWHEQSAKELANFLAELIKVTGNIKLNDSKDFPELFKSLMSGHKYFASNNYPKNIILAKVEDLILLKFDLVILANFSDGSWSSSSAINQWINEQTLRQLQINSDKIRAASYQYYYYLFLHNKQVIITRAKRQDGKSSSLPSNLLLKLQFILGKNLIQQHQLPVSNLLPRIVTNHYAKPAGYIHSHIFPSIISVTDIEMLVRNPYSFYAKKILNLKSKNMVGEEAKISEFGSFIHQILEQYSKNYSESISDKVQTILDISNDILDNVTIPVYTKKIWQVKFRPIAVFFTQFDEQRRKYAKYIYSECSGEISLNIADQQLKIIAVADRIEIDELGQAVIIDYKTGTLPTRKDIDSGLSPQLIIEALILQLGGFGINITNVKQIIYVKISSSEPYIQTVEIDLTNTELEQHRQAMVRLLEYYIINKNFPDDIDLLKYNDYTHLAR